MDCPSEEQLIRMKLEPIQGIKALEFDIPNRTLFIFHDGEISEAGKALGSLKLDSSLLSTEKTEDVVVDNQKLQKKILWAVLLINFAFFIIEMATGWISGSLGLIGDSLDMLADAFVYGLSLLAIGKSVSRKKNVARIAGYLQLILAALGFTEVIRRFLGSGETPEYGTMIIVSIFALVANIVSLMLIQRAKSKEAHMQASAIFTSNDIIINGGVIVAGLLVLLTNTSYPDLIIGGIIFSIVARGAFRILKLSK